MVFVEVDYEYNTVNGLPKRERQKGVGRERETFLVATKLVMKHTVQK